MFLRVPVFELLATVEPVNRWPRDALIGYLTAPYPEAPAE